MPVRQQAADVAVRWRLNGNVNPLVHLINLSVFMLRKNLESGGKSLIRHRFRLQTHKLWITLLKTRLGSPGRLDFQAFC
jgi:hypothetical protein